MNLNHQQFATIKNKFILVIQYEKELFLWNYVEIKNPIYLIFKYIGLHLCADNRTRNYTPI